MTNKGPSLPPSITKISLSLALGAVLAILSFALWQRREVETITKTETEVTTQVILSAMPQLLERWREGDREGHYGKKPWQCEGIPFSEHITPAFFKCRPRYMECWAKGEAGVPGFLTVTLGEKKYKVRLKKSFPHDRYTQWVTKSEFGRADFPHSGLMVDVEVEGYGHWPMILPDSCRDSYLPERVYSYGARPTSDSKTVEMMWDNFGRVIYVDKFLVNHADYEEFTKEKADAHKLALPVLGLNVLEQEAYCAWRGARRLEAHIWDAATMTPSDLKRATPEFIVKPWLPWTRDRRETFFDEALQNPEFKPTAANCSQAYVHECNQRFPYQPMHGDNVSWTGIFHVMGGETERFRNLIEPKLVLRSSSRTLPAMANEHRLGMREPSGTKAGFRCYREVFE